MVRIHDGKTEDVVLLEFLKTPKSRTLEVYSENTLFLLIRIELIEFCV